MKKPEELMRVCRSARITKLKEHRKEASKYYLKNKTTSFSNTIQIHYKIHQRSYVSPVSKNVAIIKDLQYKLIIEYGSDQFFQLLL